MYSAYFGIRRVLNHLADELCLVLVVVSLISSVHHLNGIVRHVGIPSMLIAKDSKTMVSHCLADVGSNLVDDRFGISTTASMLSIVVAHFSGSDGVLFSARSFEAQPLTEAYGWHRCELTQVVLKAGE
jgi:hypothetical protein